MKWLSVLLSDDIPLFSIIVFSERCELKKITIDSPNLAVIKRDRTYATVRKLWDSNPDVLGDKEIDLLYNKLEELTHVSKEKKQEHIDNIQNKYIDKERESRKTDVKSESEGKCPRCGSNLILRTAKKGESIGEQFWGCSNFPKCRYTNFLN